MEEVHTVGLFSPPILVYFGMGLASAKMILERENLRGISILQWLQFFVRAGSIILLWPLVLFVEKFEHWVKSTEEEGTNDSSKHHAAT